MNAQGNGAGAPAFIEPAAEVRDPLRESRRAYMAYIWHSVATDARAGGGIGTPWAGSPQRWLDFAYDQLTKEVAMSSGLTIKEKDDQNAVHIEISGEVDIYTCQELKDKLYRCVDQLGKDLVLDCRNLNYIDSTGLGVFVAVLKKVKLIDRQITIKNLKESILKLFLITKLDLLFTIVHSGAHGGMHSEMHSDAK
jgi:anti-sigma B factor antagonist